MNLETGSNTMFRRPHRLCIAVALSIAVVTLLGATGCTGSDTNSDDPPWTVDDGEPDSSSDAYTTPGYPSDTQQPAPDPDPDTSVPPPDTEEPPPERPVTLHLRNESDSAIRVVPPGCQQHEADWRKLYADASLEGEPSSGDGGAGNAVRRVRFEHEMCQSCRCSEVSETSGCGVACYACPTGGLETLQPGDSISYPWNGTYFAPDSVDDQQCQRAVRPPRGSDLDVEFCWLETTDAQSTSDVEEVECTRKEIAIGETRVVEHVVETSSSPDPHSTTFRLHNDTSRVVYTRRPSACTQTRTDWLKIAKLQPNDAVDRKKVDKDCTECRCTEEGPCAVCRKACIENGLDALKPGETVEWTWEGYVYEQAEDRQCLLRSVPPAGTSFQVAFCHVEAEQGSRPEKPVENLECARRFISYGRESTITHRLSQSPR